jgi:hypothetical protein
MAYLLDGQHVTDDYSVSRSENENKKYPNNTVMCTAEPTFVSRRSQQRFTVDVSPT